MGFFCHQFWWKFRWFDEIGEFLSDKNITNSGDNNSFRFWVLFVTNFSENSSDLKKLVSFWVKKMSPILVTIISFDFGFFCHQNWRKFKGITKIGDNFVENQCGLIYAKIFTIFCENVGDLNFLLNFRQIFHQFWWKFWWFEEIGEFLCDENVTNSVNQQIFLKKITKIGDILLTGNVTKIGEKSFTKKSENFSESIKFSVKKSPKLVTVFPTKNSPKLVKNHSPKKVKILVNH